MIEADVRELDGEGTPLVLVHSAGRDRRSYDPLLEHLGGRRVIVPSFPGRGGTPGPHRGSAAASAAWLADLLSDRGVTRAVVAGHSVGGAIAIELALGPRRDLLAGLALISTGARLRVLPEVLAALEAGVARGESADLSRWLGRSVTGDSERPAAGSGGRDRMTGQAPPETALADWKMADAFDRMKDVAAIRTPTRILSGTADPLTPPKYAAFLRDAIPGAALVSFEGAGHDLPIDRPAEVAAALREFPTK